MNKKAIAPKKRVHGECGVLIFASGITASAMHQLRQTGTKSHDVAAVQQRCRESTAVQLFARSLKMYMHARKTALTDKHKAVGAAELSAGANQFPLPL
jgi:hypothetical protein